jgi:hypothetical protein
MGAMGAMGSMGGMGTGGIGMGIRVGIGGLLCSV